MNKTLINTADLKSLIMSKTEITATAKGMNNVEGYLLHITSEGNDMILSTYLSDKPRLFKRSDALLKEAEKLGILSVCFDLKNST